MPFDLPGISEDFINIHFPGISLDSPETPDVIPSIPVHLPDIPGDYLGTPEDLPGIPLDFLLYSNGCS